MKKIAIFFTIIVIIVVGISYIYLNFKSNYDTIQKENKQFESYYNQEVTGLDVATIINKAMDINNKNKNQKDSKGNFIDNETNSINVDIKMLDNDKTYNMIRIFNGGISTFTQYYGNIKFKCTNIDYHKKTGRIKYMLFEQTTK